MSSLTIEDFDFSTSNADAALSFPKEAGQVRKGRFDQHQNIYLVGNFLQFDAHSE